MIANVSLTKAYLLHRESSASDFAQIHGQLHKSRKTLRTSWSRACHLYEPSQGPASSSFSLSTLELACWRGSYFKMTAGHPEQDQYSGASLVLTTTAIWSVPAGSIHTAAVELLTQGPHLLKARHVTGQDWACRGACRGACRRPAKGKRGSGLRSSTAAV